VNHSSLQRDISISLKIFINIYPLNLLFYHSSPKKGQTVEHRTPASANSHAAVAALLAAALSSKRR
jgi:hypothetical protein